MTIAPRLAGLALGAALMFGAAGCSRSAQSYFERGNAQIEKGNVEAAILEYRNAVARDAMFAPAREKLVEAYLQQGNLAGAVGEAVRAADLLPRDQPPNSGRRVAACGSPSENAKSRAEKALAIEPKSMTPSSSRQRLPSERPRRALDEMQQA